MTAFAVLVAAQVAAVAWFARRNLAARPAQPAEAVLDGTPPERPDHGTHTEWVLAA